MFCILKYILLKYLSMSLIFFFFFKIGSSGILRRLLQFKPGCLLTRRLQGILLTVCLKRYQPWDFPSGPVVKEPPSNAGDMGSILGPGAKIPHASRQLSPCNTVKDPV